MIPMLQAISPAVRVPGLEPYTEPTLVALAQAGTKRVDVVCPGFTSDCLETLEEIAQRRSRHACARAAGNSTTSPA